MSSAPVYYPAVAPSITEYAGTRGGTHTGIDLAANLNDPVLAPFAGQVVFVGGDGARAPIWLGTSWLYPNGEGLTVDIRRSDGLIARLGHLNGYAVQQDDWVTAGQTIGYAGTTGYSTGVHIHWELRWDRAWVGGNWVDPITVNPQVFQAAAPAAPAPTILEEDDMNLYFEAISNSSPLKPGDDATSRIWAGERKLNGITFSSVWERSADGSVRRLYKGEWDAIIAANEKIGRTIPLAKVTGNVIEQLVYGKRA